MRKNYIFAFLLYCLFMMAGEAARAQMLYEKQLRITTHRGSVSFPFRFISNLMIVPMQINGSDTLYFILDTGVNTALLTGLSFSDSLHLNYARKVKIKGFGAGDDLEAYHSYGNRFDLPGVSGERQDLFILAEDVFYLSGKFGIHIHGILGHDIFSQFIVEINYDRRILTLHDPKKCRKKFKGTVLPMTVEENKPYVHAQLRQEDGQVIKVKLIVDTGASHSISLDKTSSSQITLPAKVIEAYLGRGLNGDVRGKVGRIHSINLAGYELLGIPVAYPDETYVKKVAGVANRNGSLGSEMLKRFHVVFDYPGGRLILRPNSKFKLPFNYNMSGIEVTAPIPNLPVFVIADVAPNSPGAVAGLMTGDQIMTINGVPAVDYKLDDIIELFQSKPGRKVFIRVKRNQQSVKAEFVLERPI